MPKNDDEATKVLEWNGPNGVSIEVYESPSAGMDPIVSVAIYGSAFIEYTSDAIEVSQGDA